MSNNFPTLLNKLKMQFKITGVLIVALLANCVPVNAQTVAVAGFSFGGESAAVEKRFPISAAAIEKLRFQDVSGSVAMSRKVMALARAAKNSHLSLNTNQLANIKNSDQALVVALVITNETVFIEKFQSHKKIFISIHGEAMLFDFKAKTVIRSYPINAMIFDAKVGEVASNDLESLAARLIYADDGKSLLHQFAKKLEVLSIPSPGTKTAQIKQVQIAPEAMAHYPNALQSAGLAQSIMADEFSTVLSAKTGVPLIPPNISGATAVMWVRFEDMYDYELKLPESDYVFQLNLKRFAKIQHSQSNVGSSYIYAAYIDIAFREPIGNVSYFESELKNGEVAVVPAGREAADDFPAYQDAIRGLFGKFSDSVAREDLSWIAKAASAKDIQNQIKKTHDLLEGCKK